MLQKFIRRYHALTSAEQTDLKLWWQEALEAKLGKQRTKAVLHSLQEGEVETVISGFSMFCEEIEKKGELRGLEKGIEKGVEKVALAMLQKGVPLEDIQAFTGLFASQLKTLQQKMNAGH